MGITSGLACHLFSFLVGFGASSIAAILANKEQNKNYIDFKVLSIENIKKSPIILVAIIFMLVV